MSAPLDHGIVNLPLGHSARGGSLDRQIDRAVRAAKQDRNAKARAAFHSVRAKQARVRELLDDMADERVVALAKPLGARKPATARKALYSAAKQNLDLWMSGLEREVARPPAGNMAQIMLAGEEDYGRRAIWPTDKRLPGWFAPGDWSSWPVLSYDDRELHIVAVISARKGALNRLIARAREAGLSPVIVEPFGQMLSILNRWGWQKTVVGEGWDRREEWRPATELSDAR